MLNPNALENKWITVVSMITSSLKIVLNKSISQKRSVNTHQSRAVGVKKISNNNNNNNNNNNDNDCCRKTGDMVNSNYAVPFILMIWLSLFFLAEFGTVKCRGKKLIQFYDSSITYSLKVVNEMNVVFEVSWINVNLKWIGKLSYVNHCDIVLTCSTLNELRKHYILFNCP